MAIHDLSMNAAQHALRGLDVRADVRAHNVANQNTPGYRAGHVDFETTLRAALGSPRPSVAAASAVVLPGMSLPQPFENTVNLEDELVGMIKDNLTRDAMVNAYNAKAGLLRAAISG